GYSASGQVSLHADEDRRCEAWRVTRFASMGPPSIDYSITLFGGESNESHGSISARRRGSWHRHLGRFPPPPAYLPPRMGTLMMRPLRVGRSYKGSANCTLDSLRFTISTYSGLISIPTACRPRRSATSKVVPLPAKGSRTRHLPLPSLPSQVQVGSQRSPVRSRSTTRFHGARQKGHACGDVPARMHGSTSFSGNVAKWPSGNGCVAM